MTPKCIVLLSGGIDSTTVLSLVVREEKYRPVLLSFIYGQHHDVELRSAESVAQYFKLSTPLFINMSKVFQLAPTLPLLSGEGIPKEGLKPGIAPTWVPGRNILFLTIAGIYARILNIHDIYIGVNQLDYSGYPDCRGVFIGLMERALQKGLDAPTLFIRAPLVDLGKADIIKYGTELKAPYNLTWSCYDPQWNSQGKPVHCGVCDSCRIRRQGFIDAHVTDPTVYT